MRILLSAYACRPNSGTEPGYGWNWATHLAARGIDVHVLTAERYREGIETYLAGKPVRGLKFHYVSVPFGWVKRSEALHYVSWQLAALSAARKLARSIDFDLAHHVSYGSVHVPSQLWRLGIPVVFGPVGGGQTAPKKMMSYFGAQKRKEQVRTLFTRALRHSPLHRQSLRKMQVIPANRDTQLLAEQLGCKRSILMCDAGVPESFFATAPRQFVHQSNLKLLWVGRMLPRKALPLALDALARVPEVVSLTIVGDGLDPEKVREMLASRNLGGRVSWQGRRLTWEEVRSAYLEHDALLFTSLRDSFGCQLLEAMALGLPVIALDLHGARDFVPLGASFKAIVGQPEDTVRNLANAIEAYASLPISKRNEMSKTAWDFARSLAWAARAERMEGIYRDVLRHGETEKGSNPDVNREVFPLVGWLGAPHPRGFESDPGEVCGRNSSNSVFRTP
jgi:glycosyltransferase involved in cell wall biosynthesis